MNKYILILLVLVSNLTIANNNTEILKQREIVEGYLTKIKAEIDNINSLPMLNNLERNLLESNIQLSHNLWGEGTIMFGILAGLASVCLIPIMKESKAALDKWKNHPFRHLPEATKLKLLALRPVGICLASIPACAGLSYLCYIASTKEANHIPTLRKKAISIYRMYDYCLAIEKIVKRSPKNYEDIINTKFLANAVNFFSSKSVVGYIDRYVDGRYQGRDTVDCFKASESTVYRTIHHIHHINKFCDTDYNEFYNNLAISKKY